jgi:hypothetical protein
VLTSALVYVDLKNAAIDKHREDQRGDSTAPIERAIKRNVAGLGLGTLAGYALALTGVGAIPVLLGSLGFGMLGYAAADAGDKSHPKRSGWIDQKLGDVLLRRR